MTLLDMLMLFAAVCVCVCVAMASSATVTAHSSPSSSARRSAGSARATCHYLTGKLTVPVRVTCHGVSWCVSVM